MTRDERDQFFDTIYRLREAYSHQDDDDRVGTTSIKEVVRWAEDQLMAPAPAEATDPHPSH